MFNMKNTSSQSICNTSTSTLIWLSYFWRDSVFIQLITFPKISQYFRVVLHFLWQKVWNNIVVNLELIKEDFFFGLGEIFSCIICIQKNRFHLNLVNFSEIHINPACHHLLLLRNQFNNLVSSFSSSLGISSLPSNKQRFPTDLKEIFQSRSRDVFICGGGCEISVHSKWIS